MKIWLMGFFFLPLLILAEAMATPAQVIIIRHAEKPETGDEGEELSERGRMRARALSQFFQKNPKVTQYGRPAAICAQNLKHEDSSLRPIQTVEPLAQALHMAIKADYTQGKYKKLVKDILNNPEYDGKMVLISWSRDVIPEMAEEFGVKKAPKWKSSTFDRYWVLDFYQNGEVTLKNYPQKLLPGDDEE